jgi:hypothetical protein
VLMRKIYQFAIALVLSAHTLLPQARAQVVINEMSNANVTTLVTSTGLTEDWIELYNAGSSSVNLEGYALTDDPESGDKWYFPQMWIQAGGYVVVLASGRDVNSAGYFHTSFRISNKEASLALYDPNGQLIDECNRPTSLQVDHSYGRTPDGGGTWCYFDAPSPKLSNNSAACYAGYEPAPTFSIQGGFYGGPQSVQLTNLSSTGVVRYTLNGEVPKPFSAQYTAPINVNATATVSARVFSTSNLLPSQVAKQTYLINESNISLPVFSITTDSVNLWDYNTGIYVTGPNADTAYPYYGANYWMDVEKPCYVEYFDKNNVKRFETNAGLKIFGGYSRVFAQKSFKIKCRKHYGVSEFEFPLLPERGYVRSYKDVILRNGGSDNFSTHYRDAFMQRLMKAHHVDYMSYEPAVVYLNGQFWGFYEIREKQDERYIANHHGVNPDKIDFLSHEGTIWTLAGSDTGFYNMYNYLTTANPLDQSYYDNASKMLDIENFVDYFIAETYYGNRDWIGDWVNNIKIWRPQAPGGRWRYILWDVDWGMGLLSTPTINYLNKALYPTVPNHQSDIFYSLLNNVKFKHYFINRYADLINTTYQQDNVQGLLYQMRDQVAHVMQRHFDKWGGSVPGWNVEIDEVLQFNQVRMGAARDHIQTEFTLPKQVNVELEVQPAGAGKIKISTVTPTSYPWTGVYFEGVPVTITAMPNPGYSFSHWQSPVLISSPNKSNTVTLDINADEKLTAYFEEGDYAFNAHPNPCDGQVSISFSVPAETQLSVGLYSVLGNKVMDIVPFSFHKDGVYTVSVDLEAAGISSGIYVMQLRAGESAKSVKIVKR